MTTNSFNQIAFAQETDVALVSLLILQTVDDPDPVRVCDVPVVKFPDLGEEVWGIESNGERFIYMPVEVNFPRDDKTGTVSCKLSIQNVDGNIIRYARQTLKPISVRVQAVLSNNPDVVEADYDNFKLTNVNYDGFRIEGDLSLDYFGNEPFPSGRFTPAAFPGLF